MRRYLRRLLQGFRAPLAINLAYGSNVYADSEVRIINMTTRVRPSDNCGKRLPMAKCAAVMPELSFTLAAGFEDQPQAFKAALEEFRRQPPPSSRPRRFGLFKRCVNRRPRTAMAIPSSFL